MEKPEFWIGVDFDGTLAEHTFPELGKAVPLMLTRVKQWLDAGTTVKIMTAQAAKDSIYGTAEERITMIQDWLERHGLPRLEVTAVKDFLMVELWDDRAIQIERNTGKRMVDVEWSNGYDDGYNDGYVEGISTS